MSDSKSRIEAAIMEFALRALVEVEEEASANGDVLSRKAVHQRIVGRTCHAVQQALIEVLGKMGDVDGAVRELMYKPPGPVTIDRDGALRFCDDAEES